MSLYNYEQRNTIGNWSILWIDKNLQKTCAVLFLFMKNIKQMFGKLFNCKKMLKEEKIAFKYIDPTLLF